MLVPIAFPREYVKFESGMASSARASSRMLQRRVRRNDGCGSILATRFRSREFPEFGADLPLPGRTTSAEDAEERTVDAL